MKKQIHKKRNHENILVFDGRDWVVVIFDFEGRGFGVGVVSGTVSGVKCKSVISRGKVFQNCTGIGASIPIPSFLANGRDGKVAENLCMAFNRVHLVMCQRFR